MNSVIDFFRPPDDTPHPMRRWCYGVSITLTAGVIVFIWAISPKGVATEAGVKDKITREVAQQIKPVIVAQQQQTEAQKKTDRKLDRLSELVTENLATNKAGQIRTVISKRCKALGFAERDEYQREIDRLQNEYTGLIGHRYEAPTCGEL